MTLRTLRVFISSPGDVAEERIIARRVIGRLDSQFGDLLHLEAVFWENAPLVATASFQEQLIKPSDTDVALVILWARLGTPLPGHIVRDDGTPYGSGTEFEFEDAVTGFRRNGKPRILTYRKTAPTVAPDDLDGLAESVRQKQAMQGFVGRWFRNEADGTLKGAFHNFASSADFEELLEAHLTRLAEASLPPGATVQGRPTTWRGSSPFRGLETFEPQHAPVFCGRTAAAASVLAKFRLQAQARRAFVLIVGMSGGGKSSLVRAGVLPLMCQPGVVSAAKQWRQAILRPSDGGGRLHPALVRATLGATARADRADDDADIASPPDLTTRVLERLDAIDRGDGNDPSDQAAGCQLVLVVDQLEEAFSDERIDPADRDAFFASIDALARSGRAWVIATMRSDAYPRLVDAPAVMALKEGEGQFDLLPPNIREIGQIIRFPAAAAGLRFEVRPGSGERLDDVIRDAAARNPGALPLLQFLLEALYQRRSREDVLTFRAYEDLGGVEGALAQRAEAVFASVGVAAQQALPSVLRELVTLGGDDDSKALRRIAPRSAFVAAEAIELVDALLEARLLVGTLGADGEAAISLAHEALLEFWPRLRAWRDDDRELLIVHARLATATRAWEKEGRSADLLLARGKPLAEAMALRTAGMNLSTPEAALLAASERRARRFAQLRAGAVVGLAVLATVAGLAAWKANVESGRAQVQATTAQRTTDFMVSLFANADPDQSQGEKVTVREVLDRGVTQIKGELQNEDGVRINLLRAMGQSYTGLALYAKANDVLAAAVTQAEASGNPNDLLKARMALANNQYQNGDYDQSEALYRAAVAQATALHGDSDATVALALTGLGRSLAEKNLAAEAEASYRRAIAIHLRVHGETNADHATTLDDLGRLMFFSGRYDEAETLFVQTLKIRKILFGDANSNVAQTLNNLASLYYQTGRFDDAIRTYNEAVPIYRTVFGPEHRRVAGILNNVGRMELLAVRLGPADEHLTECLAINRKTLAAGHDELIPPLNSLAMVKIAEGDAAAGQLLLDEALEIARARKHRMLDQVLANQAEIALLNGRVAEGRSFLDESRSTMQKQYGDKLSGTEAWRAAVLDLTEASYRMQVGDWRGAHDQLTTALPVLTKRFGADGLFVGQANARLAQIDRVSSRNGGAPRP